MEDVKTQETDTATRLAGPPIGDSEEDGEQKLDQTSAGAEESRLPSAPDVTYDATLMESCSGAQNGEVDEGESAGGAKEKAVRFEEVVKEHTVEVPVEGEKGEEEGERPVGTDTEEWMDILGSGELKKKVCTIMK